MSIIKDFFADPEIPWWAKVVAAVVLLWVVFLFVFGAYCCVVDESAWARLFALVGVVLISSAIGGLIAMDYFDD